MAELPTLFELAPDIDVAAAAAAFARDGRVQLPRALTAASADALRGVLDRETPWGLAWTADDRDPVSLKAADLKTLDRAAQARLLDETKASVRAGRFAFAYRQYPLVEAYLKRWSPGHPLELLLEHLNDEATLDLARRVTGIAELVRVDGQATLFAPGQFLASHDDSISGDGRRVAYVLGLAREWRPDWGGYLLFYDDRGDVITGFMPRFNTLTLFRVPQRHNVTYVTPSAPIERFAITGWFRDS